MVESDLLTACTHIPIKVFLKLLERRLIIFNKDGETKLQYSQGALLNHIHVSAQTTKKDHLIKYFHDYFTGKYTTCKIHTKLRPGPEWCIFHTLTSEDIDDIISPFFRLFVQTVNKNI